MCVVHKKKFRPWLSTTMLAYDKQLGCWSGADFREVAIKGNLSQSSSAVSSGSVCKFPIPA